MLWQMFSFPFVLKKGLSEGYFLKERVQLEACISLSHILCCMVWNPETVLFGLWSLHNIIIVSWDSLVNL